MGTSSYAYWLPLYAAQLVLRRVAGAHPARPSPNREGVAIITSLERADAAHTRRAGGKLETRAQVGVGKNEDRRSALRAMGSMVK